MPRRGQAGKVLMDPDFLARGCVQRDQRTVPRQHIHDVIDNDRIEQVGVVISCGIDPRHLQLVHVGLVDLVERDEMRRIRSSAVIRPLLMVLLAAANKTVIPIASDSLAVFRANGKAYGA